MGLSDEAVKFVKAERRTLINKYANLDNYPGYKHPTILFMAGSPGAGKTEVSLELMDQLNPDNLRFVRIDGDEIRRECPGYTGDNAHEFQMAAIKGVEILFDHVQKYKQNAIVDGTLAHLAPAEKNIFRCVNKNIKAGIVYVYQDPIRAWEFTCKREALEKRKITRETFISAFINAPRNVNVLKEKFGTNINVFLIIKDYNNHTNKLHINIDKIENHIKNMYTKNELENMIV